MPKIAGNIEIPSPFTSNFVPAISAAVAGKSQNAHTCSLTLPAFSNVTGAGVQMGTGVDVATINRIRDQFLDIQYRAQNTATSSASTSSGILEQVQSALAEPSNHGLASQLSAFWDAWSDVANSPQSPAARQTLEF